MVQLTHICQQQTHQMNSPLPSTLHLIRFENKKELTETKWNIWKEFQRESSHEDTQTFFVQVFSLLLLRFLQS